jgi:hypothetical protein
MFVSVGWHRVEMPSNEQAVATTERRPRNDVVADANGLKVSQITEGASNELRCARLIMTDRGNVD